MKKMSYFVKKSGMNMVAKFNNAYMNISFRSKLFLFFFLAAILPSLFFQCYSYYTIENRLTRQTYNDMRSTLNQIGNNVENMVSSYAQISSLVYMDPVLTSSLTEVYTDDVGYLEFYGYLNDFFRNILILNNGIYSITIYTSNTTIPSDGLYIKHIDGNTLNSDWYNAASRSPGALMCGRVCSDGSAGHLLTFAQFLNYYNFSHPYGILTMSIREKDLFSLIEKESVNRDIFITDDLGYILSCKDKELLGKNIEDALGLSLSNMSEAGSCDCKTGNLESLMVYSTLANKWKTIAITPYHSFLQEVRISSVKFLILWSLSTGAMIFFIFLASSLFTKRIKNLTQQIQKLENGDFAIKVRNKGNDEIGQLSRAFENMAKRLHSLIKEVYEKEILKKEVELDMLQAQINPHFLYNTLSSISSLSLKQNAIEVNEMVNLMAKFYRISLNKGKKIISVGEEINLTRYYIAIQQVRFGEQLRVSFIISEDIDKYKTIKLILQPFVENCINHAIWDENHPINILIKAYHNVQDLCFEVIDDGAGMDLQKLSNQNFSSGLCSSGYGIYNVDERIKLYYGKKYGVKIFSKRGIGTKVQICIPAIQQE